MELFKTRLEEVVRGDVAKSALLEVHFFSESLASLTIRQDMLTHIELLTSQNDAAKRELSMAQDTARTYYEKMLQAQAEASKHSEAVVVNLILKASSPLNPD